MTHQRQHLQGTGPLWLILLISVVHVGGAFGEDTPASSSEWHYGATVDLSYALDFNFPENHRWRSKGITPRVNELAPNMVQGYVRKDVSETSRWGMEFGVQGGYDTNALVPDANPGRGCKGSSNSCRANLRIWYKQRVLRAGYQFLSRNHTEYH